MNPIALSSLASFVIAIFLGAFVYFRNPKALVNKRFFFLSISIAAWVFFDYGYASSHSFEEAVSWWKFDFFWVFPHMASALFAIAFIKRSDLLRSKWLNVVIIAPAAAIIIGHNLGYPVFDAPVKLYSGWMYGPLGNRVISLFGVFWFSSMQLLIVWLIVRHHFSIDDAPQRRQTAFVALAFLLPFIAVAVEWALYFLNVRIASIAGTACIIGNLLIAYAIWKYELFALTPMTAAESIVTTMSDALLLVHPDRTIASGNLAAGRMLGVKEKELSGPVEGIFREDAEKPAWMEETGRDTGALRIKYLETWFVDKYGKGIPVSLASSMLFDERGNQLGYLIIARDIAERIKKDEELREYRSHLEDLVNRRTAELDDTNQALEISQEQLRELGERLATAKEEESARIARELQDELGQLLTGMKIDASMLGKKLEREKVEKAKEYVSRAQGIRRMVESAIQSVLNIAKQLRPRMLDEMGLVETIQWIIREFEQRTGVQVAFKKSIDDRGYDSGFATAVYRIIQESLTNAARHAGAKKISIAIEEKGDILHATVEDDGVGIEQARAEALDSFGLMGMNERAQSFGGEVNVSGAPGQGTRVLLTVPIARVSKEQD